MSDANHFAIINRINLDTTPSQAAAHWNADPASLQLVNHGINVVYRFIANDQAYYLKLTHAQLKSPAALTANWDFLLHLAKNSAPVSPPALSAGGQKVVAISQNEEIFLASVAQAMPGQLLTEPILPEDTYIHWGRALAHLHNASASFQPTDPSHYLSWDNNWNEIRALIDPNDHIALTEFEQVDAWFQTLSTDPPDFGLTHADFRAGNMLLCQGRITIIDFDEPVWHWYPADLARPFLELADCPLEDRRQALNWFIQGYRTLRPMDDFWVENLPWFMRMNTLGIYTWSAAHWDPRQPLTRPEWIDHYQHRFTHPLNW